MPHSRSFIRPCAEFPNDNPLLHDGVSWVCLRVGAPLRPVARARLDPPEAFIPSVASIMAYAPVATHVADAPVAETHVSDAPVATHVSDAPVAETHVSDAPVVEPHEVATEVAAAVAEMTDVDVEAIVAAGVEATAPPPSVFALSPEISGGYEPDTTAEERQGDAFGELALELTPARSEVRAIGTPDDLELDDLELNGESFAIFTSEGGADVDFSEGETDAAAAEADAPVVETVPAATPPDIEVKAATATSSAATPSAESAFQAFVAAVAEVATAAGAAGAAGAVPAILSGDSVASDALLEGMRRAPSSTATVFDHSEGRIQLCRAYRRTGEAWAAILRGDAGDMSACGTSTLDGWAGDVLRALGVGSDGAMDVKRELRRRGVAAFGMLLAA